MQYEIKLTFFDENLLLNPAILFAEHFAGVAVHAISLKKEDELSRKTRYQETADRSAVEISLAKFV